MKRTRIEDINTRITLFRKEFVALAREYKKEVVKRHKHFWKVHFEWSPGRIAREAKFYNKQSEYLSTFQNMLADCFYEQKLHNCWLVKVREAADRYGFKVAGAGRTRIALSIEYNSETVIVKLAPNRFENDVELKNMNRVIDCEREDMLSVMLTPLYFWKHPTWGTVLVFPQARTFGKEWSIGHAKRERWDESGLPTELQTGETVDRLETIEEHFCDAHEFNIGFVNNLPVMIDVNFGVCV